LPDGIFSNQKIPIWVNFGGSCNGKCLYILWPDRLFYGFIFGIFCGHFVYFIIIWYIFPRLGMLYHEKYGNPGVDCWQIRLLFLSKSLFTNRVLALYVRWNVARSRIFCLKTR
jgi:hypothetical protein